MRRRNWIISLQMIHITDAVPPAIHNTVVTLQIMNTKQTINFVILHFAQWDLF